MNHQIFERKLRFGVYTEVCLAETRFQHNHMRMHVENERHRLHSMLLQNVGLF